MIREYRPAVDTYINNLPRYKLTPKVWKNEKIRKQIHDSFYYSVLRDFDRERNPPGIPESVAGSMDMPWVYIDFDPYEAWLGRQDKPLLKLRVETWECREDTWSDKYTEKDY